MLTHVRKTKQRCVGWLEVNCFTHCFRCWSGKCRWIKTTSDLWFMKVVQPIVNQKRGSDFRPSLFYVKNRIRISIDDFESDDRWANKRSTVDEERRKKKSCQLRKSFSFLVSLASSSRPNHNIRRSGTWFVVCNKLPVVARKIRKWRLNAFLSDRDH